MGSREDGVSLEIFCIQFILVPSGDGCSQGTPGQRNGEDEEEGGRESDGANECHEVDVNEGKSRGSQDSGKNGPGNMNNRETDVAKVTDQPRETSGSSDNYTV